MFKTKEIINKTYQLEYPLNQDITSQSWLGKDLNTNQFVTLKFLKINPDTPYEVFLLWKKQSIILQQLDYPYLAKYFDYCTLCDNNVGDLPLSLKGLSWLVLVQEYIKGDSLQQLLNQGQKFNQNEVTKIATAILKTIDYLHKLNPSVIHKNIKPSNLILGEDGHYYLTDLSQVFAENTTENINLNIVNKNAYQPLEQLYGKATLACDLYCLGATLIHLLTGLSPDDLPRKNYWIQWQNLAQVTPEFVLWINHLIAPSLDLRFSNTEQALKMLKNPALINSYFERKLTSPFPHLNKIFTLSNSSKELNLEIKGKGINLTYFLIIFSKKMGGFLLFFLFFILGSFLITLISGLLSLLHYVFFFLVFLLPVFLPIWMTLIWPSYQKITYIKQQNNVHFSDCFLKLTIPPSFSNPKNRDNYLCYLTYQYKKYGFSSKLKTMNITQITTKKIGNFYHHLLFIDKNKHEFELKLNLSKAESFWLINEINQWLDNLL